MTYDHKSQYDPGCSQTTRQSGCTWTTGANGVGATTDGVQQPKPDAIHDLVHRGEETNPATPGWSLPDLVKAMTRYGLPFVDHSGQGWSALETARRNRHYIALQGDSDQFGNATCSGSFDGDHCIGIHPRTKVEASVTYWWIDDPICPTGRWEKVAVLKRYAAKLNAGIQFGYWLQPVPAAHWEVDIAEGTRFAVFTVSGDRITRVRFERTQGGVHAPCSAPHTYHFASGVTRQLVTIGGNGPRAGDHVHRKWASEV